MRFYEVWYIFVSILCRGGAASPCNSHHQVYSFLGGDPYKLSLATVAGCRSTSILLLVFPFFFGSQDILSHNFRDFQKVKSCPSQISAIDSFKISRVFRLHVPPQSLGGFFSGEMSMGRLQPLWRRHCWRNVSEA